MTMDFIIEFHIVNLIKQKQNVKLEYYKTRQSECYYEHWFTVHVHYTDWLTTLLMKTNQKIKQ